MDSEERPFKVNNFADNLDGQGRPFTPEEMQHFVTWLGLNPQLQAGIQELTQRFGIRFAAANSQTAEGTDVLFIDNSGTIKQRIPLPKPEPIVVAEFVPIIESRIPASVEEGFGKVADAVVGPSLVDGVEKGEIPFSETLSKNAPPDADLQPAPSPSPASPSSTALAALPVFPSWEDYIKKTPGLWDMLITLCEQYPEVYRGAIVSDPKGRVEKVTFGHTAGTTFEIVKVDRFFELRFADQWGWATLQGDKATFRDRLTQGPTNKASSFDRDVKKGDAEKNQELAGHYIVFNPEKDPGHFTLIEDLFEAIARNAANPPPILPKPTGLGRGLGKPHIE